MVSIPQALQPLALYPQFVLWKAVPSKTRPGAVDKLPVSPTTGIITDAHNPAIWLDADTAIGYATANDGLGVGFVFTVNDPFFFLDIDKCLDPSGQWSTLATELCQSLQGAAVEISQSGKGLHIIGSGVVPAHGCKNTALGLELYTEARFVALTGTQAVGSADFTPTTLTQLVDSYFQPSATSVDADWTNEPCPEWKGPKDDDKLITKILKSKSIGGAFNNKASVQALWHCDVDALTEAYPDGGGAREFDRSSADAALCQHLAFWTGKDCERMARLFQRSELCRDKWLNRPDYQQRTILHAVGLCTAVYGNKPSPLADSEPVELLDIMAGTEHRHGFQYLPIPQQLELFKGCVYIRDLHRVFTPDGALLKAEQFKAIYGGYVFALDSIGDKTTRNAWEVFTESQGTRFPRAHGICFRPEKPSGTLIAEEGRILLNTYTPIETPTVEGDITPFLDHLAKVLPEVGDRAILLAYMAACVQYPGVKFQWCPLLQGCEGNGKTLFLSCVAHAVGHRYTHLPNASDLGGNGSRFNAWIQNKLFIGVEEVYVSDRREVLDALKPLITNSRVEIQGKGIDQVTGDNRANFIMCSNHKDAILKTQNDRRFCVFYTGQQEASDLEAIGMGGLYFPNLYKWLADGGYAVVTGYLRGYAIPDALNPAGQCHRAPTTSSTEEALTLSLGGVEQDILEAINEDRRGFIAPWVSSMALNKFLEEKGRGRRISPNKRIEIINKLGYVPHPGLKDGRVNSSIMQEMGKPRLYIKAGHIHTNLTEARDILHHYLVSQGYLTENQPGQAAFDSGLPQP